MNHSYRSIWNESTGAMVAVAETAKRRGKKTSEKGSVAGYRCILKSLSVVIATALGSASHATPEGGTVVAGNASITSTPGNITIDQSSQNVVLNWQSFDIGVGETVNFVQPNSNAVALNRVLGADPSSILGSLSANGKIFLINPNGVLFGTGAQVNVGGLIASSRDIADGHFMAGHYEFNGVSGGGIENRGSIRADGGYVALLGARVSNEGVIAAKLGTVALAAGDAFTLDVAGDGLLNVTVNAGAVGALASNGGLLQADGGQVLLSAESAGDLLHSAVSNTGIVQAQTIENRGGVIKLLGDMQSGAVMAGGTLDASAPHGGNGGFVDTSAAHVQFAPDTLVTTAAPYGTSGLWLIDPVDFTIAASGGDITGTLLSTNLGLGNVVIQSGAGASGVNGDINVNDTVTWSANRLTLHAYRNININRTMNGSGSASLAVEYGQGAVAAGNTATVNVLAPVHLPAGNNFSTLLGSDGVLANFTVITSLGAASSTTGTDLQGIEGNLTGNYALGSDIDASATSAWNAGAGFAPLGPSTSFSGTFDGLGHVIRNLHINRPVTSNVALFSTSNLARFQNVGVIDSTVVGYNYVGLLAANNVGGTYNNVYSSGTVTGNSWVGGLLGLSNGGTINKAHSSATVNGSTHLIGGLAGQARFWGSITNSYATGTVNAPTAYYVGGLTGQARFVTVTDSYATGAVTADGGAGGLVGFLDTTTITSSYATGPVSADWGVGGLVGTSSGSVSNSYWNTTTSGQASSAGGTGLTSAQMQAAANFTSWNFSSTWVNYEGLTNPLLRSFLTPLTVTAGSSTVTYDGAVHTGSGATYSITPNMSNVLGTLNVTGSGTNAGTYTTSASGLYSNQSGYLINYESGTLTINPAVLTATAVAADKVYDGTASADVTLSILSGLVGSETLGVSGTATFNSKDVAHANLVTVNTTTLSDGSSGGLAANYTLASGQTTSAHITPKPLSATISAPDKVYDGNATAAATVNLSGLIGSETLGSSSMASFNSKDVATANLVTLDSVTLTNGSNGGLASNYSLASGQTTTAHITARALTVVGQTALDKVYDGTNTATLTGGTLAGVVTGDSVTLHQSGTFAQVSIGNDIAVTATDSLGGTSAANYTLTQPTGLTADITAPPVIPETAPPVVPETAPPASPENPPEAPPEHVPVDVTTAAGYRSAVGHAAANAQAVPSATPVVAASGSSEAALTTYEFAELNLTVVTRDPLLLPGESPPASGEDD